MKKDELAGEFEKRGRLAPCLYFSGLGHCHLGYQLDCLNCPKYEPHEPPGPFKEAICEFETGRVYHIMEFAESDGFYRRGKTLCGIFVDEGVYTVEIYGAMTLRERRLCQKCEAATTRKAQYTPLQLPTPE